MLVFGGVENTQPKYLGLAQGHHTTRCVFFGFFMLLIVTAEKFAMTFQGDWLQESKDRNGGKIYV